MMTKMDKCDVVKDQKCRFSHLENISAELCQVCLLGMIVNELREIKRGVWA